LVRENRMSASSSEPDPPTSVFADAGRPSPPVESRLTYQVILRHLAKFRDGAHHLLDLLRQHAPDLEDSRETAAPAPPESPPGPRARAEEPAGATDRPAHGDRRPGAHPNQQAQPRS